MRGIPVRVHASRVIVFGIQRARDLMIINRVLALVLIVLAPRAALAQGRGGEWGHPMGWMWGAGGALMMLLMVIFWVLVIGGLMLGLRWLLARGPGQRRDRAREILRERYARGELSKEEFDARRRDLDE